MVISVSISGALLLPRAAALPLRWRGLKCGAKNPVLELLAHRQQPIVNE
jgi:hypothetical protein